MFSSSSSSLGKFPSSFTTEGSSSSFSCSSTSSLSSSVTKASNQLRWRRDDFVPSNTTPLPPIFKVMKNTKSSPEEMILSFLSPKELAFFSEASTEINRITVPFLRDVFPSRIRQARELFKEIVAFDPIDENRLHDGAYCGEIWRKMLRKIKADPMIRQIFEANNEDLASTAQTVKDRDLLICCRKYLPANVVLEIEDDRRSPSGQATRAREWIEANRHDPLFNDPELIFERCGLKTIPMEFISKFTQLLALNLSNNQIQVIPEAIGRLVQLLALIFEHNRIQVIPEAIGRLVSLIAMGLVNNQIQVIPEAIGNLVQLQFLNFEHNQIQVIPEAIGRLVSLRILKFSNNQIQVIPEAIGRLVLLRGMTLSNNRIQVIPEAIGRLVQLHTLELCDNPLKTISAEIYRIPRLHLFGVPTWLRMKAWASYHKWSLGVVGTAAVSITSALALRYSRSTTGF